MDVIISALIEANKLLNKKDYYKALDCFELSLIHISEPTRP